LIPGGDGTQGHGEKAVLAILDGNRAWFMTYADLAIWLYGDDRPRDIAAIRMVMCRLRRRGHRFEVFHFGDRPQRTWITGVRLLSEPSAQAREAA
jgi:hypothetical protein